MTVLHLSSGCEGPQGPPGVTPPPLPYVTGEVIFAPSYWDSTVNAIVQISWAPSMPVVKVNGVDCPAERSRFGGELQFSSGNLPVSPGDSVSLSINYLQDDGASAAASGNIVLPGQFYIASPDTANTVQLVLNEGELTAT